MKLARDFAADTSGVTAIEYGLIGTLIAAAIVPALLSDTSVTEMVKRALYCNRGVILNGGDAVNALGSCRDLQTKHF